MRVFRNQFWRLFWIGIFFGVVAQSLAGCGETIPESNSEVGEANSREKSVERDEWAESDEVEKAAGPGTPYDFQALDWSPRIQIAKESELYPEGVEEFESPLYVRESVDQVVFRSLIPYDRDQPPPLLVLNAVASSLEIQRLSYERGRLDLLNQMNRNSEFRAARYDPDLVAWFISFEDLIPESLGAQLGEWTWVSLDALLSDGSRSRFEVGVRVLDQAPRIEIRRLDRRTRFPRAELERDLRAARLEVFEAEVRNPNAYSVRFRAETLGFNAEAQTVLRYENYDEHPNNAPSIRFDYFQSNSDLEMSGAVLPDEGVVLEPGEEIRIEWKLRVPSSVERCALPPIVEKTFRWEGEQMVGLEHPLVGHVEELVRTPMTSTRSLAWNIAGLRVSGSINWKWEVAWEERRGEAPELSNRIWSGFKREGQRSESVERASIDWDQLEKRDWPPYDCQGVFLN